MKVRNFWHGNLAVQRSEANVNSLIAFPVPGNWRSAFSAERPDGAAGGFVCADRLRFVDDQRIPRDADEGAVHAVILPALGAVAKIGVVKRAFERKTHGATQA